MLWQSFIHKVLETLNFGAFYHLYLFGWICAEVPMSLRHTGIRNACRGRNSSIGSSLQRTVFCSIPANFTFIHLEDDNLRVLPQWDVEVLLLARTDEEWSREANSIGVMLGPLVVFGQVKVCGP